MGRRTAMARRITSSLLALALGCVLVLALGVWPAGASASNPYRYWSNEQLTPGNLWGTVRDLRGDYLLFSETFYSDDSASYPSETWLLDISSGSRSLICTSSVDPWTSTKAKSWGDYVAYTTIGPADTGSSGDKLFLLPIHHAGESIQLSQGGEGTIQELEIDGGYVAWVEEQGESSTLYLYSIQSGESKQLAAAPSPEVLSLVTLQEGKLAWSENAALYLYDIASASSVLVAQAKEYVTACIAGGRLAWNQDGTLWLQDSASGVSEEVATNVGDFDLSSMYLVWTVTEELSGGLVEADVYLKELAGGVVTRLTDDDLVDLAPQVSDHWVVWRHGYYEGGDVVAYDLARGQSSIVAQDAYGFLLEGDRVAWDQYRGRGDVFLAQAHRFSDVPPNHPNYLAVEALASEGAIRGYPDGTFRPSEPAIRQQFAKMVVEAFAMTVTGSEVCPFADVSTVVGDDPFYPAIYVAVCARNNITRGKDTTHFAPYAYATRAQIVTMVVRAAHSLYPASLSAPPSGFVGTLGEFSPDHADNMRIAEANGLLEGVVGFGPGWNPWSPASRGEVCQILHNWRLEAGLEAAVAQHVDIEP
jgi:hypothetical protein